MKPSNSIPALVLTLLLASCSTIPNAATTEVLVNGNCSMCEETIEEAGLKENVSEVDWDRTTRKATITFDSTETSAGVVLQRIAQAGYDNERFIATDEAYAARPMCCQYERTGKTIAPPTKEEAQRRH
ncbi:MAG: heavy-metal-associated domain-containing protein [Flavobacteriales bacterium]|jgi:copper chaperone CopZ|nr:heavy-metal-associated domain-containing protein [Flavobacteriales bacterium]MBL7983780.1 heavy-metal-associated domain-containing protein [Flavobacteriales bacterium]